MSDVSRGSGSLLDHYYLTTVPLFLFSLSFAYVSHHTCLAAAATSPLYPFLTHLALLVLIPMVMGLLSPRGSQITTPPVAGTGCDVHDARAMFTCVRVLLVLLRSCVRFLVGSLG